MGAVIAQAVIDVVVLGVVVGLGLLAGPIRHAAVGQRFRDRHGAAGGHGDHDGPAPPQFPGPFFPGG